MSRYPDAGSSVLQRSPVSRMWKLTSSASPSATDFQRRCRQGDPVNTADVKISTGSWQPGLQSSCSPGERHYHRHKVSTVYSSMQSASTRYGNSRAIWDHTVLFVTRHPRQLKLVLDLATIKGCKAELASLHTEDGHPSQY